MIARGFTRWAVSMSIGVATAYASAAPFGAAEIPSEVARLIPDGAFITGYSDSLSSLQQSLVKTTSAVEPQLAMAAAMGGPSMLNMLVKKEGAGPGSAGVKLDGAGAFFMGPLSTTTGEPISGAIFEVADATDVVATQPTWSIVKLPGTNWVSLASAEYALPESDNAITDGMLNATLAFNIDQALVVKTFKPQIDAMLMMMQMQMPPGTVPPKQAEAVARAQAANVEKIKMFLGMFSGWNIGVDLDGANIDALLRMTPTDSSQLITSSGGLDRLAMMLPSDLPIAGVMDRSALLQMMEMTRTDLAAVPEDVRERLDAMMGPWKQCLETVKSGTSFGMSFGSHGIDAFGVMDSTNPARTIEDISAFWSALRDAKIGIEVEDLPLLAANGVGYTVKVDVRTMMTAFGMAELMTMGGSGQPDQLQVIQDLCTRMLGEDGTQIRYLVEGDLIVNVVGNKRLGDAKRLAKSGGTANALTSLLSDTLASPTWAAHMDIRQIADEGLSLMRMVLGPMGAMLPPRAPEGAPVVLSLVGTSDGTTWDQVRVRTNLKDWYTMMGQFQAEAMRAQMEAAAKARQAEDAGTAGAAP